MYVLVAGGGKIGYYLARSLLNDGHEVLIIEKSGPRVEAIANELGNVVLKGNADEASVLVLARFVGGFGSSLSWVAAFTWLTTRAPDERRG